MKSNIFKCSLILLLINGILFGQNTSPLVSNISHNYNSNDGTITITYDLYDAEQDYVSVIMQVSDDGGESFTYSCSQLSGDIYLNVPVGTNKQVIWDHDAEHPNPPASENFVIRILANDEAPGGSPCPDAPTVHYGGVSYPTIKIGNQCWMAKNLNIGTRISGTSGGPSNEGTPQSDNGIIEKYCYNNEEINCTEYGGLYQWNEAMQYTDIEGAAGICPQGWHIPNQDEIENLLITLSSWWGNSLKEVGQGIGEGAGTNTSGFSALLCGICIPTEGEDAFEEFGNVAHFWTSSKNPYTNYNSHAYALYGNVGNFDWNIADNRKWGISVRCIMD